MNFGAFIAACFQAIIGSLGALFSGWQVFFCGIFLTALGVILYNLLVTTVQEVLQFALTQIPSTAGTGIPQYTITGIGAWFVQQLQIVPMFSFCTSMVITKFILRKIPFLNW